MFSTQVTTGGDEIAARYDFGFQQRHYVGDRYRMLPLSPAFAKRLRRYVERSRPADATSDRLFVSRRRSVNGGYDAITESGVQQMIRDLAERAGIRKRVHPICSGTRRRRSCCSGG